MHSRTACLPDLCALLSLVVAAVGGGEGIGPLSMVAQVHDLPVPYRLRTSHARLGDGTNGLARTSRERVIRSS
jgi:hypothetical protein